MEFISILSIFWNKGASKPVLDEQIGNAVRLTQGSEIESERFQG